jgi:hypothetical protein
MSGNLGNEPPKWIVVVIGTAFSALIISAVAFLFKIYHEKIETNAAELALIKKAIAQHHGQDWEKRAEETALQPVTSIISRIDETGKVKVDHQRLVETLIQWSRQGDDYMHRAIRDKFTCGAGHNNDTSQENKIKINLAHDRANLFQKGQQIRVTNLESQREEEVTAVVVGFYNDMTKLNELVQLNRHALEQLNLNPIYGHYRVSICHDNPALAWKSFEEILNEHQ